MSRIYPKVLVITGCPGAGKSTIANVFSSLGAINIDADRLAHEAMQEALSSLKPTLPTDCFNSNGKLIRPVLRKYFLDDEALRNRVEALLHPRVREKFERQISTLSQNDIVTYELPLLFEKAIRHPSFVASLCVLAADSTIKKRLLDRGLAAEEIEGLLRLQLSQAEKSAQADFTVNSEQNERDLKNDIVKIFTMLRSNTYD